MRLWWRMTRGALVLVVVIAAGLMVLNGDFRGHHLGFTHERDVQVAQVQQDTQKCSRASARGDLVTVIWQDGSDRGTAWWTRCPDNARVEGGDTVRLWVADGRKAYDGGPWELYAAVPLMAVGIGTALTVIVLLTNRGRIAVDD
ncbi:hypothetical protein JAAN108728_08470 [Janibacter anophelis]